VGTWALAKVANASAAKTMNKAIRMGSLFLFTSNTKRG